jgi:hypothetical protein
MTGGTRSYCSGNEGHSAVREGDFVLSCRGGAVVMVGPEEYGVWEYAKDGMRSRWLRPRSLTCRTGWNPDAGRTRTRLIRYAAVSCYTRWPAGPTRSGSCRDAGGRVGLVVKKVGSRAREIWEAEDGVRFGKLILRLTGKSREFTADAGKERNGYDGIKSFKRFGSRWNVVDEWRGGRTGLTPSIQNQRNCCCFMRCHTSQKIY